MTPARAIPILRQMADEAIRSMGGVHPWSKEYRDGCAVLGAMYLGLDSFRAKH